MKRTPLCLLITVLGVGNAVHAQLDRYTAGPPRVYREHDPAWHGVWIWAPHAAEHVLRINPAAWLLKRPGGWGPSLVNRLLGHAAASGYSSVVWELDHEGRLLYPNDHRDAVLQWPKWAIDFAAVDYPRLAARRAVSLGLTLRLEIDAPLQAAAQEHYPDLIIHPRSVAPDHQELLNADWPRSAREQLDRRVWTFRKTFQAAQGYKTGCLSITAEGAYRLYVNGQLIGADDDWWLPETYDISELLRTGSNTITAVVEPDRDYAGLVVNLRWLDHFGEHMLTTERDWQCRPGHDREGEDGWVEPSVVGIDRTGPRFRLKMPWMQVQPPMDLAYLARVVPGLKVVESDGTTAPEKLVDGGYDDPSNSRFGPMPAHVVLGLDDPVVISAIRLYDGYLRNAVNPSGAMSLRDYRLEYQDSDGAWQPLLPVVRGAQPYAVNLPQRTCREHTFTPRSVRCLRLTVLESNDTGRRVNGPAAMGRGCRVREVELLRPE